MSVSHLIATILLFAGVIVELIAVLGLLVMRDVFDRLHYVGLAGYGALMIAVAILVRESFSMIGDQALAAAIILLTMGPVLVHTTARTLRIRHLGDWRKDIGSAVEDQ